MRCVYRDTNAITVYKSYKWITHKIKIFLRQCPGSKRFLVTYLFTFHFLHFRLKLIWFIIHCFIINRSKTFTSLTEVWCFLLCGLTPFLDWNNWYCSPVMLLMNKNKTILLLHRIFFCHKQLFRMAILKSILRFKIF